MRIVPTAIPEVVLVEPTLFRDDRGFFLETFQAKKYAALGVPANLVQDNHSGSRGGVLRGLHYQVRRPQGKLVSVLVGQVFDVAVDLRRWSPTFGEWVGLRLSAEDHRQLWIPPGFAHGFYVLSAWAELAYKVSDYYDPEAERTLRWDDPRLDIHWPLAERAKPILSPKDARGVSLADAEVFEEPPCVAVSGPLR
jgi:dTDP-4-dehydrorhamnose 3,5-epimerase